MVQDPTGPRNAQPHQATRALDDPRCFSIPRLRPKDADDELV